MYKVVEALKKHLNELDRLSAGACVSQQTPSVQVDTLQTILDTAELPGELYYAISREAYYLLCRPCLDQLIKTSQKGPRDWAFESSMRKLNYSLRTIDEQLELNRYPSGPPAVFHELSYSGLGLSKQPKYLDYRNILVDLLFILETPPHHLRGTAKEILRLLDDSLKLLPETDRYRSKDWQRRSWLVLYRRALLRVQRRQLALSEPLEQLTIHPRA